MHKSIEDSIESIVKRMVLGGGFAQRLGAKFRADATAWSILALSGLTNQKKIVENACRQLATIQLDDGRVPISDHVLTAYWPTALAIFSWQRVGAFESESKRAINFLLHSSGLHSQNKTGDPSGHDTSLKGWPWVENTHSWIEPSSMSILALRAYGLTNHDRVREAIVMVLDRQLPSGGWNMGNTVVFGKELLPVPETTGQALSALGSLENEETIKNSLCYLNKAIHNLRTPLSLSWAIFGLTAWNQRPENYQDLVFECIEKQDRYGPYDTDQLAQLILVYFSEGDLIGFLTKKIQYDQV